MKRRDPGTDGWTREHAGIKPTTSAHPGLS